jgi:hypothetical protein
LVIENVCEAVGVSTLDQLEQADEKVNAASMPHFPLLARGAAALTTFLHSYGMHSVVEAGKSLGLKKFIFSGGEEDMPELSAEDRKELIQIYEEDIAFVEERTGRDLSGWRE